MIPTLLLALAQPALAEEVAIELRERGSGVLVRDGWLVVAGQRIDAPSGRITLDLATGSHALQVASPLHMPSDFIVVVPADELVKLYLRRDDAPLEIVVEAERPSPHASRQVLDRERIEQTPGAFDDPFRLVQSLPGVTVTREFGAGAGDIALRGAPPAESRVYLDGVELPYLYHFDQYASVVPSRQLDELAVYPSAFGPTYGDAVGGVIAATSRTPQTEGVHGIVDVNLIMAGGDLSVPIGDRLTLSASGRRSYLDLISSSNDQYTLWPVFHDFNGRVDWHPTADHDLALVVLGAGDSYGRYAGDTAALDPLEVEAEPAFESDRDFQAALLRADNRTGSARLSTVLGLVHDDLQASVGAATEDHDLIRLALRHETLITLGPHTLSLGADGSWEQVALLADTDRAWPELLDEAPLLEAGQAQAVDLTRGTGGAYVEPRLLLGRLTAQPGLRIQISADEETPALDPRLTLQYAPLGDLQIRAAAGLYHQSYRAEDWIGEERTEGWTPSQHAVLGVDWAIAGRLELSAEGWLRHSAVVVDDVGETDRRVTDATGLELVSRYRLRERIFAAAVLSLSRIRQDGSSTAYDQPYAMNLLTSWDFAHNWNAGLRWRYAAGTPFTPVVSATYDGDSDRYIPAEGSPYSERMAPYQKVDVRIERRWDLRSWHLRAYLELWWVPPGNNVLYPVYSFDYSQRDFVVGPPLVPLVGLRASF